VVSDRFTGMSRVQQHQLVYELFTGRLGGEIHALSLKTETP
jgi:stress-induced morphogen